MVCLFKDLKSSSIGVSSASRFKASIPSTSLFSTCTTKNRNSGSNGNADDINKIVLSSAPRHHSHPLPSDVEEPIDRASKIDKAQKIINYEFQNNDLLWEALQAPNPEISKPNGRMGNKALASVGDAVATLVIKLDCYKMNYTIVSNYRFALTCEQTGLATCINLNPSQGGIVGPRTRADSVEAVIGAVYQDGGIDSARSVMRTLRIINYAEA
ncbi:ribonuclease III domain-containing protein [Nemania diffusa]|nr:ribonuclease III domain-containing protein [Nemania diffusa]